MIFKPHSRCVLPILSIFIYILIFTSKTSFGAIGDLIKLPPSAQYLGLGNILGSFAPDGENNFRYNPSRIAPQGQSIISYSHQFPFARGLNSSLNSSVVVGNLTAELPFQKGAVGFNLGYNIIESSADNQRVNNNALTASVAIRYASYRDERKVYGQRLVKRTSDAQHSGNTRPKKKLVDVSLGASIDLYHDSIQGGSTKTDTTFLLFGLGGTLHLFHTALLTVSVKDFGLPVVKTTQVIPTSIGGGFQYLFFGKRTVNRIGLSSSIDITQGKLLNDTHNLSYNINFFFPNFNDHHKKLPRTRTPFKLIGLDIGVTYFIENQFNHLLNVGGNVGFKFKIGNNKNYMKINYGIQYRLLSGDSHVISLGYHY